MEQTYVLQFKREVKHSVLYSCEDLNGVYLPKFTVLKPVKNGHGWPAEVTITIKQKEGQ